MLSQLGLKPCFRVQSIEFSVVTLHQLNAYAHPFVMLLLLLLCTYTRCFNNFIYIFDERHFTFYDLNFFIIS